MRGRSTGLAAVVVAVVMPALVMVAAAPVSDASPHGPDGGGLTLLAQTPWVEPEGELALRVRPGPVPEGATLRAVVHDPVRSRSEFQLSLQGESLRRAVHTTPPALLTGPGALTPDAEGAVLVRLPVRSGGGADPARIRLPTAGVYPVEVVVAGADGGTVDRLVTHLIRSPGPEDESPPLAVALVLPVHAPPALRPDGTTLLDPPGRAAVTAVTDALGAHPLVPVSVVPTPETVDALAEGTDPADADLLARLRTAVAEPAARQVLASTYVRLDLAAWVEAGLDDELGAQLSRGTDLVADQLAVRPDPRTWIADGGVDGPALAELRQRGVDQVVVPERALEPLGDDFPVSLSQPFSVTSGLDSSSRAAQADAALAGHLANGEDPVLAVHQLLADLAVLHLDRPGLARGVVVAPPEDWVPDARALDALLGALGSAPVLAPVTLDQLFELVAPATADGTAAGEPLVRGLTPEESSSLDAFAERLAQARLVLGSYRSMIGPENPRSDPFEERLLVSGADELTSEQRLAYVGTVSRAVSTEARSVEAPAEQTISLTAHAGEIPLTLRNEAGYPLDVVLQLDSDKLEFPGGPSRAVTLAEETLRLDIAVRARASGEFPLLVRVTSPDGQLELTTARVTVRSTAVSGVGVVLSVGAGLFLLVWWARHFRSVRRDRRLVPADTGITTPPG